jgi:hypothetical protein
MLVLLTLGVLAASPLGEPDFPGLPIYAPQDPLEANRSVLFSAPLLMPTDTWGTITTFDYASAIESYSDGRRSVLLDAELARLQFLLSRRLDDRWFAFGQITIQGAYDGFIDQFINWYHKVLGVNYYSRNLRPINRYAYEITYGQGKTLRYGPVDLGVGDSRLGVGRMLGKHAQLILVFGLPTSTGPGFRAGTLQTGLILTGEFPFSSWLMVAGSVGICFTPRTGTLAQFENVVFASFSGGVRVKLSWRNFLYGNLFVQTPPYHGTGLHPMDLTDFSADFGWIFRIQRGTELWIGLGEDPYPDGPALDVTLRFGLRTGF